MPTPVDADPAELLSLHRERLRRLIARLVAPHDADDVEQEVWLAALERPPRHASALPSWIGTTVRNLVAKSWRGRDRRRARESVAARAEPQPATADLVARVELEEFLLRCVRELPEPERAVVLRRFFDGLGSGEIAARLGVGESTVRARLARALARLRERLDAQSGGRRETWLAALAPMLAGGAGTGVMVMTGKVAAAAVVVVALAGGVLWWRQATPRAAELVADSKGPRRAPMDAPTPALAPIADAPAQRAPESPAPPVVPPRPAVAAGELTVRVVDAATLQPLASGNVRALSPERFAEAIGVAEAKLGLKEGTWEVAVSAEGYEPEFRRDVAITAGAMTDLGEIALGRGTGSLSIRLRGVAHGAGVTRRIEVRGEGRSPCPECAPGGFSIASTSTEPDAADSSPYQLAVSPCCGFFTDRSLGTVVDDAPFEFRGLAAGIYFVRVRDRQPRLQPTLRIALARGAHRVLDLDVLDEAEVALELEDEAGRPFVGLWDPGEGETTAPIRFRIEADGVAFELEGGTSADAVRAALGPPPTLTSEEREEADAERVRLGLEQAARSAADRARQQPSLRIVIPGALDDRARQAGDDLFGAPATPGFECIEFAIARRAPAMFLVSHLPASRVKIEARCRALRSTPVEIDLANPSQRTLTLVFRAPPTDR